MASFFKDFHRILGRLKDVPMSTVPYVVLVGNVGSGKSTIVEKLTGEKGRSSDADESVTKYSEYFWVPDKSLLISDTPGANPVREKVEHNTQIAAAFNLEKVAKVFIVVKADTRIDTTIEDVRKYADRFISLPMNAIAVLVTHMDNVKWSNQRFLDVCDEELGISQAVFSRQDTPGENLLSSVIEVCGDKSYDLTVTSENFFKLFKIHNNNRKILQITSDQVELFKRLREDFEKEKKQFDGKELVDLYFEFQAFMTEEITRAQQRMTEELNFTFMGDHAANEAGHVANMVNQLCAILYDVRTAALGYQSHHGCTDLRKCPHCGLVWAKIEGCDGATTCGNRPSQLLDVRDSSFTVLGTFTFRCTSGRLSISRNGTREIATRAKRDGERYHGCGRAIKWSEMARVEVPKEFCVGQNVSTDDISLIKEIFKPISNQIDSMISTAKRVMSAKSR